MLSQPLNITKINIALGLIVVILSFYTIVWHHQNYLLYKEYQVVQKQKQKIMAMRKQLLSEYSEKISGAEIKKKALDILQMKSVDPAKVRAVLL